MTFHVIPTHQPTHYPIYVALSRYKHNLNAIIHECSKNTYTVWKYYLNKKNYLQFLSYIFISVNSIVSCGSWKYYDINPDPDAIFICMLLKLSQIYHNPRRYFLRTNIGIRPQDIMELSKVLLQYDIKPKGHIHSRNI